MKVGDIVTRKISTHILDKAKQWSQFSPSRYNTTEIFLGEGIILSKQMAGSNPVHPCITVWYPSAEKTYDIAESLMELVDEGR
jgi:hypothetical protein|tara:strand:- start:2231 stop:2479 length:249 start_codon:yes stop_codon:yes gene_type:complete